MIGRRTGDLGRVLALLSVGCAHAPMPAPRFVSVTGYEAAAAAYACEDEYELVEVEGRGLGPPPIRRIDGSPFDVEGSHVVSGTDQYVIQLQHSPGPSGASTLSVTRPGEAPITLATGAFSLVDGVAPDGYGTVLVTWYRPSRTQMTGALVSHDAIVPLASNRFLGSQLLAFARVERGWLAVTRVADTSFLWRVDASGAVTDVEEVVEAALDVAVIERGGERALVWRDERGLVMRARGATSLVLPARPRSGWLRPQALLAASDGYWLVVTEEWIDAHFRASVPQLRVLHVGFDGAILGEARTASPGWFDSVTAWLEDDALWVWLDERVGTRVVGVAPRTCDSTPPVDVCAPRTFRPGASPLTGHHWEHEGDRIHYRDGAIDWTLPVAEGQRFMPLFGDDRVAGLLQGDDGVRLVSLDPATGAVLAERALGEHTFGAACATQDLEHLALLGETGATLLDREGHTAMRIDGDFEGCALAPLRDRLAWALARTEVESSAGPITAVELLVLSRDGRSEHARHETGLRGRAVALLATEAGAWLGWAGLGIGTYWAWPLDAEGTPTAAPHRVADLRLFPATTLAMTELGPALLWSSEQEEGVVPLCHVAEGLGESGLVSATYPVSR